MTDRLDFETRLEERLRARAALASRPFDAAVIARRVVEGRGRRRRIGRLAWPSTRPGLAWLVVGLLLAIALLGAVTLVGALLREHPPVRPSGASNGWIAFAVTDGIRGGASDIYVVRNGVAERRIIGADGDGLRQVCPTFSPDGARLAYSEVPSHANGTPSTGPGFVVIVTVDTAGVPVGPPVRLPVSPAPDPNGSVCPHWAPDSLSLAFVPGDQRLWIGRLDGTETPVVRSQGINLGDRSPDGTAVVAVDDQNSSVWIVPLDGSAARLLARPVGTGSPTSTIEFTEPRWSPDGTRIAVLKTVYAGDATGLTAVGSAIEVYRADGSGSPIELAGGHDLAWSPDGRRLAYVRTVVSVTGLDQDGIVTVAPEAHDVHVIPSDGRTIRGLAWSPDGKRMLYVEDTGLISASTVDDAAPIVLTQQPHDLEFTDSNNISWQGLFP